MIYTLKDPIDKLTRVVKILIISSIFILYFYIFGCTRTIRENKPNFIIIFADDLGYGDVGCYGAEDYDTPQLDRMAKEGVRFTDFYVPAAVCTPSRAGLLTGSYPMRLGLGYRVLFPYSETGLNPEEITISEILKEEGYNTCCIGKWHLGHQYKFLPIQQGFDYYFGIPYSNDMGNFYYTDLDYISPPLPLMRQNRTVDYDPEQRYLTRRYTEEVVIFIKRYKDEPFFIYLAHSMPHIPIDASPEFKGNTEHGLYGDVINELDWSVGQILKTLKECGIDKHTMVIFTSDNGPHIAEYKKLGYRSGSSGPLRGHKNTTWEGGMRVPCIMCWPGKIPAGLVCSKMATAMDLLPTIAYLSGGKPPHDRIIDGKDIRPLIFGEEGAITPHNVFYYYRDERLQAVRSGKWKLHVYRPEWKSQDYKDQCSPMLYNLEVDIGEQNNIAEKYPDVVKSLLELAEKAREDLGDAVTNRKGKNIRSVGTL